MKIAAFFVLTLVAATASSAQDPASADADVRARIAARVPPAKPENVRPVPDAPLYEVTLGNGMSVYVTADGRYMVAGDLFDLNTHANLSELARNSARRAELAKVSATDAIVFKADGQELFSVTVFTDPDCGYCRKFHHEIAKVNSLGITVRYLAFPRSGPGSESWDKTEAVWCSPDRKAALTRAKLGLPVSPGDCQSPILQEFELGQRIGVHGTPMVVSEEGLVVGGYVSPQELLKKLEKSREGNVVGE